MERHIKFFGKQVTCLNVLQSKTTRSKAVGHQVGFILDAARESQSIRDHGISCDVLEHIQPGVPNLWAWMGISCQISTNIRLEIKCTINAMCLNHPETIPLLPWSMKILSSCNQFLVPKILRTADIQDVNFGWVILRGIYARLLP